ncbi:hypothetical protein [Sphingomonas sp.]|uniref:hypothetical protein n=1 Tax=Sphingomonas sp. TaxID=28214 RepID=UPI002FD96C70
MTRETVSVRKWRQWERRAVTLLLKSQDLLSDMIAELGEDSAETDYADGVVEQADNLAYLLHRQANAKGTLK